jgi:Na+-translocating ferredoxin:NAD+ oxidoreductase subunit C
VDNLKRDDLGSWSERLRDAGVSARRHNSHDLTDQLFQALRRPVDTVLVSLLDADESLALNGLIASRYASEIVAAATAIGRLTGARATRYVLDPRSPPKWFAPLYEQARRAGHIVTGLADVYPQADPTLLLYSLFKRRLRPGRPPVEQGVILIDGSAALAVGRFAISQSPMTAVPIAIADHVSSRSHFYFVSRQATLSGAVKAAGLDRHANIVLRQGDLLRDLRIDASHVIDDHENLFYATRPEIAINPSPCIRCSWCYDACPTRVQPARVLEAAQSDDPNLAEQAGIEACIDCGLCSYVCPSQLPLVESIRTMRTMSSRLLGASGTT